MLKIKVIEPSGASIEYQSEQELDITKLGHPETSIVEIEDISAQLEQERANREALEYLASTDWMIIRELDAGIPCSAEVKQARAEARARIVR